MVLSKRPIGIAQATLIACTILFLTQVLAVPPVPPSGRLQGWNVALITLDATSAARIGVYGGRPDIMPFFDSLARRGLVVAHAYCTTGSTSPSHATILSGLLPEAHGVSYNGLHLPADVAWLPEILKQHGYQTLGSTAAFHLGAVYGFSRGFDRFAEPTNDADRKAGFMSNRGAVAQFHRLAQGLQSDGPPFFAWIHLKGGHEPRVPADADFLRRLGVSLPTNIEPAAADPETLMLSPAVRKRQRRVRLAYYDAALYDTDTALEDLVTSMRTKGLARHTLFIVTADHGESFDHGIDGEHWPSPWESTLRIPMIVFSDGAESPKGILRDRLVSTEDVAPTTLDLLGLSAACPREWRGASMFAQEPRRSLAAASVSSLAFEEAARRFLRVARASPKSADAGTATSSLAEAESHGVFYWSQYLLQPGARLAKLIHFGVFDDNRLDRDRGIQLYDVSDDALETKDLMKEPVGPALARKLLNEARRANPLFGGIPRDLLAESVKDAWASRAATLPPPPGIDAETARRLRSLGYLR